MPLDLTIELDLDHIIDWMDDIYLRQIPYAAQLALNESVFKASNDLKGTVSYFIEGGATPFTKRGFQYKKAKSKRELTASIFIPDTQWDYMRWVVDGGTQKWNQSPVGGLKPIYENTRFNKYGNIPGRARKAPLYREILKRGKGRAATPLKGGIGKKQFVGTVGDTTGVWTRTNKGHKLKLNIAINKEPVKYRARFPFIKFAHRFIFKRFNKSFPKKFAQVLAAETSRFNSRKRN